MENKDIEQFKKDLKAALNSELEYYNFEITPACAKWVDSVVDYYVDFGDFENNDLETAIDIIIDEADEMDEDSCFEWPTVSEAAAIVGQALKDDSSHFMYITDALNMSMSPDDCFRAEWFWEGSIRPSILDFIKDYTLD